VKENTKISWLLANTGAAKNGCQDAGGRWWWWNSSSNMLYICEYVHSVQ